MAKWTYSEQPYRSYLRTGWLMRPLRRMTSLWGPGGPKSLLWRMSARSCARSLKETMPNEQCEAGQQLQAECKARKARRMRC
eukprot:6212568-Pleurochrysis_carterae.AAC.1